MVKINKNSLYGVMENRDKKSYSTDIEDLNIMFSEGLCDSSMTLFIMDEFDSTEYSFIYRLICYISKFISDREIKYCGLNKFVIQQLLDYELTEDDKCICLNGNLEKDTYMYNERIQDKISCFTRMTELAHFTGRLCFAISLKNTTHMLEMYASTTIFYVTKADNGYKFTLLKSKKYHEHDNIYCILDKDESNNKFICIESNIKEE